MRLFLAALALCLALPAHAQDWWEAETAHFIIKSRDSESSTREFAETVERFDRGLRFLQGLPEDHVEDSRSNKPIIYRFGDYTDMSRWYGDPEAGVAGFFISRAGKSVAFAPARLPRSSNSRELRERRDRRQSVEQVLLHEYVHYFMHQNVPAAYPRWYSEGYAEMMSTMRFFDDGGFHIGDPPQSRGVAIYDLPSSRLDEMLDSERTLTGYAAYQHYVTGWLFSHYLSFDPEREAKLRQYLVALGNGEPSLPAAQRILGDLDDIQRDLVRYMRGPFPGYDVRPNVTAAPAIALRQLEGAEKALIEQEMRLWRGGTREQAARVAADIRRALTDFPDSSYAYGLLAEAEHDAGNSESAAAAAQRAVELDPANLQGWLYRARIALDMAEQDPAHYEAAREHLAQARQIDLGDPRPLILYYDSFYQELGGRDLPDHAIIALEQAFDEAGNDDEYRLKLGRQLVLEDRLPEALIVMQPTLFSGHKIEGDGEEAFTPGRLVAALDTGNRQLALELLAKALEPAEDDEA